MAGMARGDGWIVPVNIFIETEQFVPEHCSIFENIGMLMLHVIVCLTFLTLPLLGAMYYFHPVGHKILYAQLLLHIPLILLHRVIKSFLKEFLSSSKLGTRRMFFRQKQTLNFLYFST